MTPISRLVGVALACSVYHSHTPTRPSGRVLPSIFQASRSQAKENFTHALQVTVASARISHAQA